jgi:triacylglycerol lipase
VNIIVLRTIRKEAYNEFRFEQAKLDLNDMRKENEICKTKYPILMVHGIFFRDWQRMNYWGRIPKELVRNGAEIYYGNQQSANLVSVSAEELRDKILEVVQKTGAEKINIIAHSKGGLDSRYAISKLGMDKYVASLTTINTPHFGCKFVDKILSKVSDGLFDFVDRKYNKLFTVLGDTSPSFRKGVTELTYASCERLNEAVPDSPNVYYHSVMSKMNSIKSAGFPLNIGYLLNKPYGEGNDGLVTVESGLRGESVQMIEHKGKRGISHGDMIDLFRENIKGFDVREFYVELVKNLKDKGF